MPVLTLHFPKELVDRESFEDLLLNVEKKLGGSSITISTFMDWMRSILRSYTVNSLGSLSRWESTKMIPTLDGGSVTVKDLDFWKGDAEGLDDGAEGEPLNLLVGKLQYEYLKRAVAWENTYQREIMKSGIEHKNVAALARWVILHTILSIRAKIDEERLLEEEKALRKEPQGEDPGDL